jgi:hypothetical protein
VIRRIGHREEEGRKGEETIKAEEEIEEGGEEVDIEAEEGVGHHEMIFLTIYLEKDITGPVWLGLRERRT